MRDNMEGAAEMNSIEVRGRGAGKSAEQRRRIEELRAQGIEVEQVKAGQEAKARFAEDFEETVGHPLSETPLGSILDAQPRRVIPAWQYRELEQIEGLDMSAFEADESQSEKPREQQRFYSNRAMRRAAARDKTSRSRIF